MPSSRVQYAFGFGPESSCQYVIELATRPEPREDVAVPMLDERRFGDVEHLADVNVVLVHRYPAPKPLVALRREPARQPC